MYMIRKHTNESIDFFINIHMFHSQHSCCDKYTNSQIKDKTMYLGQWYDNNASEKNSDSVITCVRVEGPNAYFSNGAVIPCMELDLGERYERIAPAYAAPEVSSELSAQFGGKKLSEQVVQSQVLGDLSKIGSSNRTPSTSTETRVSVQDEPEAMKAVVDTASELINDPVATFINSAILISRKAGKKTVIPVTINLDIDFDIIDVIETSMKLGASDTEILHHIMKYINVSEHEIKKLIAEVLMSPDDIADDREETFNETLREELIDTDTPAHRSDVHLEEEEVQYTDL